MEGGGGIQNNFVSTQAVCLWDIMVILVLQ